jgi:hypothetical protein
MPVVMQTICDGCGMVKKDANHWYTGEFTGMSEAKVRPMGPYPASLGVQNLKYQERGSLRTPPLTPRKRPRIRRRHVTKISGMFNALYIWSDFMGIATLS